MNNEQKETVVDPVSGTGEFFTSPEVLEAIGAAPWKPLDIPELDISFKRFYSASYQMYVAAWNNGCDAHVYALTVERVREDWFAIAANDGHEVFRLSCNSKFLAARIGLAAMRAYLIRGHRRTWRRARAAACGAVEPAPHPAPLTPEEELADTIKRQKEAEAL